MDHDNNRYLDDITTDKLKWVGVDLDGTLSEFIWPDRGIGKIKPGAKECLDKLVERGYKIIVYTARQWSHYESIEKWCLDNGLTVRRILCGKPLFRHIIDDVNIEFDGDWTKITERVLK